MKIGYGESRRMLKNLTSALILYEKIRTTGKRAKLARAQAEKLITKGKINNLHNKRQLFSALPKNAAKKIFEVLGPKYKERTGGYTRMTKIGKFKDGTAQVQLELV